MRGSWHNYFKPGIIHFMAFPDTIKGEGPILETLEEIATDDFFTAIEVTWIQDPKVRKEAGELLAASQLEVAFGAQPLFLTTKLDLNSLDEGERAKAVAQLKMGIDQGQELGAKRVAFLSGWDPGEDKRKEATDKLVDSIVEACGYAKEKGISLTMETFDRDVDKKCLMGPNDESVAFAERIRKAGFPDFGLTVDLSHFPLQYESTRDALHTVKDHLVHAHMGNCVLDKNHSAYGDSHPRFDLPGGENGVEELAEFFRGLFEIGFLAEGKGELPIISFEVKPLPGETPQMVIANAKRTMTLAWRLV